MFSHGVRGPMKLTNLFETSLADKIRSAMGLRYFKKLQDPNRPEKLGTAGNEMLPSRSGNQDTPLTPRLRKYFNAPTGNPQGKSGFGEPGLLDQRPKDNNQPEYPVEKTEQDKEIEKNAKRKIKPITGKRPKPR